MSQSPNGPSPDRDGRSIDLIQRARSGEREALNDLIDTWRTYLLHITSGSLRGPVQSKLGASDIVQSACLEIHECFDQFHGESVEEWKSWLRSLVIRDIQNVRRRFRDVAKRDISREQGLVDPLGGAIDLQDHELTPQSSTIAAEESQALRLALRQLSDEHRQVLRLRNWEELSFVEIGRRLGRSADAARKLWGRAADSLARQLERSGDNE